MFFLLRVAFWLSVIIILLPTGRTPTPAPGSQISAIEAMFAAGAAVSDLSKFCGRQPDACAVGSQAAVAFGHKAQASAKMLYEFLSEKLAHDYTAATSATGSIRARNVAAKVPLPLAAPGRSRDTLMPSDLTPAWRGPAAHTEG